MIPSGWSGRTMARSGLRMMPTSPSSPLKLRKAGFPRYGFKAGLSGRACPRMPLVKPAPGIPARMRGLPEPFALSAAERGPAFSAAARRSVEHRHAGDMHHPTPGALAPVRVLLSRSINTYLAPSVPLAGTARFRRTAVYTRCLRCAGAPRRPTSGSVLSLRVPSRHATLHDPGEFAGCTRPAP